MTCSNWVLVSGKGRHPNQTLGGLVRKHYPGMVLQAGRRTPPYTWAHFYSAEDAQHGTVAQRIKAEFWVSLRPTKLVNTTYSLVNT
jgi:hypothetical protein